MCALSREIQEHEAAPREGAPSNSQTQTIFDFLLQNKDSQDHCVSMRKMLVAVHGEEQTQEEMQWGGKVRQKVGRRPIPGHIER